MYISLFFSPGAFFTSFQISWNSKMLCVIGLFVSGSWLMPNLGTTPLMGACQVR